MVGPAEKKNLKTSVFRYCLSLVILSPFLLRHMYQTSIADMLLVFIISYYIIIRAAIYISFYLFSCTSAERGHRVADYCYFRAGHGPNLGVSSVKVV